MIRMQEWLTDDIFLTSNKNITQMKNLPVRPVFDEEVCEFIDEISKVIMKNHVARKYPDIITFAYFCRKANIEKLKSKYRKKNRLGRGLCFQIAPSNIPIIFAYSMIAGILAGNAVIVKVSSKQYEQTRIICETIKQVQKSVGSYIAEYIAVVQYDNASKWTEYLSSVCDIRVIWGGDSTINQIRNYKLSPRAVELTFANRYSICIMCAKEVLAVKDWNKLSREFYNDTFLYDQNACSAPRLIYWIGTEQEIRCAQDIFWNQMYKYIKPIYSYESVIAVDKLIMDYRVAIENEGVKLKTCDNLIHRIGLSDLDIDITKYMCAGGLFLEYGDLDITSLEKLVDLRCQTLVYFGFDPDSILKWIRKAGLKGIDRVVPIGRAADFSFVWDGFDLIESMSREICY